MYNMSTHIHLCTLVHILYSSCAPYTYMYSRGTRQLTVLYKWQAGSTLYRKTVFILYLVNFIK